MVCLKKPLIFFTREYKRMFRGKMNDFVDRILKITSDAHVLSEEQTNEQVI